MSQTFNLYLCGNQSGISAANGEFMCSLARGESMFRRIRNTLLLVALVVGVTSAGMGFDPSSAGPYTFTRSASSTPRRIALLAERVRLGLMQLSYGIIDQLQVTTFTMPWILGAIFRTSHRTWR